MASLWPSHVQADSFFFLCQTPRVARLGAGGRPDNGAEKRGCGRLQREVSQRRGPCSSILVSVGELLSSPQREAAGKHLSSSSSRFDDFFGEVMSRRAVLVLKEIPLKIGHRRCFVGFLPFFCELSGQKTEKDSGPERLPNLSLYIYILASAWIYGQCASTLQGGPLHPPPGSGQRRAWWCGAEQVPAF